MFKTLRKTLTGLAAVAALTAIATPAAMAQEKSLLDDILARGKLIVGTGSTNAPWHFKDEQGNLVGFDIDIAKMIATGLFKDPTKIEFVEQSSDARIPNVTTGKVDITCQFMTVTAERAQQVAVTIPYYREGVGLLLKSDGKYKSFDELKKAGSGAVISVLQNVYAEDMVHAALPEAKVDQYESVDLMYQALDSGQADGAATDQSSVQWLVVKNPGKYVDSGYGWGPQSYSCAVKRGDQQWLNFVNTVLHEGMTGVDFPTYQASFKKWFGVDLPVPAIGFPVEYK
jgi:polar amino acid transport system substrate-binding protein